MVINTKLRIIYAGTPEFAVPALKALIQQHNVCAVFTQPDRPAGRGQHLTASPVKLIAQHYEIPVHQPKTLKDSAAQQLISDYNADMMIVAAYGLILPQAVLTMPRLGCLNIHASCLPRWRGAAPIQRAILAGDQETGITIMQMAAGLDTGDVWYEKKCVITERDTAESLQHTLATLGAEAIVEALPLIQEKKRIAEPQKETCVTYAEKLTKLEARLNWQQSALQLSRAVRAYNPWPVAYSELGGEIVRIWDVTVLPQFSQETPGTIVGLSKAGVDVATGDGILRLQKLQWPGKKILEVANIMNAQSATLRVGAKFV